MDSEHRKTYSGLVGRGEARGKALGFPTANIPLADTTVSGIYAASVRIFPESTEHIAAVYADQRRGLLEAHLLDFSDDLYGKEVEITLGKKIRDSEQFTDEELLKIAIARDIEEIRAHYAQ